LQQQQQQQQHHHHHHQKQQQQHQKQQQHQQQHQQQQQAMGEEFAAKGSNVQLGPGLNVARVPLNGRNFEYLSGEDPFLGSFMVPKVVEGIQGQGVVANAKHFVQNNQETNRGSYVAQVDERAQFELYMPPFEAAVKAGVGSFMW
jgi:beta-glucosidase